MTAFAWGALGFGIGAGIVAAVALVDWANRHRRR